MIFSPTFLRDRKFDLQDFCYYYERPFENSPRLNRLYAEINCIVDAWKREQSERDVLLWYEEGQEGLEIFDSRTEPPVQTHLTSAESCIYRLLGAPIAIETLRQRGLTLMENSEFDRSFARLEELKLLFQEGGLVIGIAVSKRLANDQASFGHANGSGSLNEFATDVNESSKRQWPRVTTIYTYRDADR